VGDYILPRLTKKITKKMPFIQLRFLVLQLYNRDDL
jgi:hypothetical protein